MPATATAKVRWDQKTPSGFDLGTGGAKAVDSDAQPQTEVVFGNGAFTIRLRAMSMHATVDRPQVIKYTREIVKRNDKYNKPSTDPMKLSQISTEDLENELQRRKDEHRPRRNDKDLPLELRALPSPAFFKVVWRDVLGRDQTISKQRVRDHDERLMKLVEAYISNRLARGLDLGELEGITFIINGEKSHTATKRYAKRHMTVPAPTG